MSNKNNNSRKLFVGPAVTRVAVNAAKQAAADRLGPQFVTNLQKLDQTIDSMSPNYKTQAAQAAIEILRGNTSPRNMPPVTPGSNNGKPWPAPEKGGSITVFKGQNPNSRNDSYALSKNPNPKDIRLNSGVRPNTFTYDNMAPVLGQCSPLHMSGGVLSLPTDVNNPLTNYILDTIVFDIQTRAQANVNFSLDVSDTGDFSAVKIRDAMSTAIKALQVYFHYSSILSYESDPRNKNAGMIALRKLITAQNLSDLSQLGRRLQDTPLPPRIVEWVRYMSGNFLSSNTQCAPIIKLFPSYTAISSTTSTSIFDNLTNISLSVNNNVYTLMRRAIPQWRIGVLYDCNPIPTYDANFKTIFANKYNVFTTAGTNVLSHTVANADTSYPYNSYLNKLDGVAFAMCSLYNNDKALVMPGLMTSTAVNTTQPDNRYSFYTNGATSSFVAVQSDSFLALSRQETATNLSGVFNTPHLFGTAKCLNVSTNALMQTAENTVDFLFNVDSIPNKGAMNSFSGKKGSYI